MTAGRTQIASAAQMEPLSQGKGAWISVKMTFGFALLLWIGFILVSSSLYDESSPRQNLGPDLEQDWTASLFSLPETRVETTRAGARRLLLETNGEVRSSSNIEEQQMETLRDPEQLIVPSEASVDRLSDIVTGLGRVRRAGNNKFQATQEIDSNLKGRSLWETGAEGQQQGLEGKISLSKLEQTDRLSQIVAEKRLQQQKMLQILSKERLEYERQAIQAEDALASEQIHNVKLKRKIDSEDAEMRRDALDQAENKYQISKRLELGQNKLWNSKVGVTYNGPAFKAAKWAKKILKTTMAYLFL